MEMTLAIVALTVVLLVAVMLDARRVDRRKQQGLEELMAGLVTEKGRGTLDEIALIVSQNKHVLGRYHTRSREFRDAGSYPEAVRSMQHGCEAIEKLAPDFVSALRSLRRLARSVSVIVALPPVRPYAYQAWELRGLAGIGGVLHRVLVTGQERTRLRLRVLTYAFGMALRWLRRSTDRVAVHPETTAEWKRIDDLVADLVTTGDETLFGAERIVQALDAVTIDPKGRGRDESAPGSVGLS